MKVHQRLRRTVAIQPLTDTMKKQTERNSGSRRIYFACLSLKHPIAFKMLRRENGCDETPAASTSRSKKAYTLILCARICFSAAGAWQRSLTA
jgi:hypothetical protein